MLFSAYTGISELRIICAMSACAVILKIVYIKCKSEEETEHKWWIKKKQEEKHGSLLYGWDDVCICNKQLCNQHLKDKIFPKWPTDVRCKCFLNEWSEDISVYHQMHLLRKEVLSFLVLHGSDRIRNKSLKSYQTNTVLFKALILN